MAQFKTHVTFPNENALRRRNVCVYVRVHVTLYAHLLNPETHFVLN